MITNFLSKHFKPTTVGKIKSWGFIGGVIVAIVFLVVMTDGKKTREKSDPATKVNIVTSSNSRELGLDAVRNISKNNQNEVTKLKQELEKYRKENAELQTKLNTSTVLAHKVKETEETVRQLKEKNAQSEKELAEKVQAAVAQAINEKAVKNILSIDEGNKRQLNADSDPNKDFSTNQPTASNLPVPKRRSSNGAFSYGQSSTVDSDPPATTTVVRASSDLRNTGLFRVAEPKIDETKVNPSPEIYLPRTSMLTGVLLTGLDAPTHQGAQESPYPVLVRIKKEAVLPNFKTVREVRECFALMSGYGDLSTERAFLRGEGITCIKKDGLVLERKMSGYATGEDSKAGLKGTLVTRNSKMLVNAMMSGFSSGVASAFNVQPTANITTNPDGSMNYVDVFNAKAAQGGFATGASTAMEKLADYYMNLANQTHPVIEIGAGRVINIVLTEGN